MPCDTITTQSVVLAKAMPELVKQALEDTGWRITSNIITRIVANNSYGDSITWETGKGIVLQGDNAEKKINEVNQAYSKRAVTWAAQRAGWQVTINTNNTLNIIRR